MDIASGSTVSIRQKTMGITNFIIVRIRHGNRFFFRIVF